MNIIVTCFVAKAWNKDSNNNSNTESNIFTLRWFTPATELVLCGHATLAAARAVFNNLLPKSANCVKFQTKFNGIVEAYTDSSQQTISLNFPLNDCRPFDRKVNPWVEEIVKYTLGPQSAHLIEEIQYSSGTKKLLIRLKDSPQYQTIIYEIKPNFEKLLSIDSNGLVRGVIVTQKSESVHFVSRYFAPWNGINEDPVTGSAHTVLAPYWKTQYEKSGAKLDMLIGQQCSQRGGTVFCRIVEDRVQLSGKTRTFVSGIITL